MSPAKRAPSRTAVLGKLGIFSGLGRDGLKAVADAMTERSYSVGAVIFREGDRGEEMHVIVSGSVTITIRAEGGEEIELARIPAGGFFGEMAIVDDAPRSATCRAAADCSCLVLDTGDFDRLIEERPKTASAILDRMLAISAQRLMKTSAFLSQMVQYGDEARRRAITDPATGLFNRRYLDDSLEEIVSRAKREVKPLSFGMFDLDRFGKLNKSYGAEFCDQVILRAAAAMRAVFLESDILVRYGGDEFCFLFPETGIADALARCESLCDTLRSFSFPEHPELRVSCSVGVSQLGPGGTEELKANADKALYAAKEAGRDRAVAAGVSSPSSETDLVKREIPTVARKNRIIANVVKALDERDSFLIFGHKLPDEDCVSAMVSFGLLASKFNKKAAVALGKQVPDSCRFLLNICQYNSIHVIDADGPPPTGYSSIVIVDTPKPEMIDRGPAYEGLFRDPSILKIEIDHHLESDSTYAGDPGHRLVMGASSSCEIVGLLAYKMYRDRALMDRYQIAELFTRNIVLSILSGIIADSRMGKYLKTRREKWFYAWFSSLFERLLAEKTRSGSGNFSSKEQVYEALASLTEHEKDCYELLSSKARTVGGLRYVALDEDESAGIFSAYGSDTVAAVSRATVDRFAEESGRLGLVAYYDAPGNSDFVQFRLRRSQSFGDLDLREAIVRLGIENGGGHPGAVGFRIPKRDVGDFDNTMAGIAARLNAMLE